MGKLCVLGRSLIFKYHTDKPSALLTSRASGHRLGNFRAFKIPINPCNNTVVLITSLSLRASKGHGHPLILVSIVVGLHLCYILIRADMTDAIGPRFKYNGHFASSNVPLNVALKHWPMPALLWVNTYSSILITYFKAHNLGSRFTSCKPTVLYTTASINDK